MGKTRKDGRPSRTKSQWADLHFPVGRILRYLKKRRDAKWVGPGAGVYIAALCDYLAAELLELAGNSAKDNKRKRIIPRDIGLAVWNDPELDLFFKNITIAQSGRLQNIHSALRPPNTDTNGLQLKTNEEV